MFSYKKRDRRPIPQEVGNEIVSEYLEGANASDLGRRFGYKFRRVLRYLESRQVPRHKMTDVKRKYSLNQNAFESAEAEPEAAYWTGFLMADGSVSKGGTVVKLSLAGKDHSHVMAFAAFLDTDMPVSMQKNDRGYANSSDLACLHITSSKIVSDLARYGVVPNKTKTARVLILENSRDFWRGCVDGDGWVSMGSGYPVIGFTGSRNLVEQFVEFAHRIMGIRMRLHKNHSIWSVSVSGTNAVKLITTLYKDSTISLQRKSTIAKQAIIFAPPKKVEV